MTNSEYVLSKEEISGLDRRTIESGIPSRTLMRNAAYAVYRRILALGADMSRTVIVCGGGNNGGDGYALALLMEESGIPVSVLESSAPKSDDCVYYSSLLRSARADISALASATLIVDAMYGFSFRGSLLGRDAEIAAAVNSSEAFVLAVDLPSGVSADGDFCEGCVCADATCTFTAEKYATASYPSKAKCGRVFVEDIGVPSSMLEKLSPGALLVRSADGMIKPRSDTGHKGSFGTLAVLAGCADMPGAAALCAAGALCSGVGLVKIASEEKVLDILKIKLDEPVYLRASVDAITESGASALLVGCGIGRGYDGMLADLLTASEVPSVIDADGINFLAAHINVLKEMRCPAALTPHPGEMARLTGTDVREVERNRIRTAGDFAQKYGCYLLLKGSRTVIAAPDGRIRINTTGNSALSKGGSGDVLAGVAASLAAQGYDLFDALTVAAYVHGKAGERLSALYGAHGARASRLSEEIGRLLG